MGSQARVPRITRAHDLWTAPRQNFTLDWVTEHRTEQRDEIAGRREELVVVPEHLAVEHRIERDRRAAGTEGLEETWIGTTDGVAVHVHAAVTPEICQELLVRHVAEPPELCTL